MSTAEAYRQALPVRWRRAALAVAFLVAASVVAQFGFFFFRDNFSTHYPLKVLSARVFQSGAIPYWNFHDGGGQPMAGNPNALTFYPDNVLYLLLPGHVAFNLHFLLHLAGAFLAMRWLLAARGCSAGASHFGAALYAMSGMAVSATAFYNLIAYVALIPFALWAVERRSLRILGVAFGLMLLAAEPIMILSALIAVAIAAAARMRWLHIVMALALAGAIGSPQLIAYSEIAGEVERVLGFSSQTVLNASLHPLRLVEILVWPVTGFLTDPERLDPRNAERLFSTLFVGVIAIPALVQRSRYTLIAGIMLFFALGRFNPVVAAAVDAFPAIRVARYPEKFAVVLIVALCVLSAQYFDRVRWKRAWVLITFLPLVWAGLRALPIDWFRHYRVTEVRATRVYRDWARIGGDVRESYRRGAAELAPLFGAVAGVEYVLLRSPDNMHSLLSRMVAERFENGAPHLRQRYLRMAAADVPGALPYVSAVTRAVGARDVYQAVAVVENPAFDDARMAAAPARLHGFASAPATVSFRRNLQSIAIDVKASGPALLLVNESYFAAWVARSGETTLETVPLNVDRLGVLVPAGSHRITLTFGRRRILVAGAWIASSLLLIGSAVALAIEERQRRSR